MRRGIWPIDCYHICERKGWAEDALDYNALGSSWSEISRLAASERGR